jgi:hypothetical protein
MTQRHFLALAGALRDGRPSLNDPHRLAQWREDVERISAVLRQFNPAFQRGRFLVACGYQEVEEG